MEKYIVVKGAKENNLKNIDVKIPRNKLVVFSGVSGSGKSSLAFDTIFAESQRKYLESLSSYARQFLGQMDKPNVVSIDGLSPSVSIDQKSTSNNPRSTVGTITEIHDYLRLLFARVGHPHCPKCGKEVSHQTIDQIVDKIIHNNLQKRVRILAPTYRGKKGEFEQELNQYKKDGYLRVEIDGEEYLLDEVDAKLDKNIKHTIKIVVDRLVLSEDKISRLTGSVSSALALADGLVEVDIEGSSYTYSTKYSCPDCDINIEEITPRLFSFNSPYGACPACYGLANKYVVDPDKILKHKNKSIYQGALHISVWNLDKERIPMEHFMAVAQKYNFSLHDPIKDLPKQVIDVLLYGDSEPINYKYKVLKEERQVEILYEGLVNNIWRRYNDTSSDFMRNEFTRYMKYVPCDVCGGKRLRKEALAVTINGKNIADVSDMPVNKFYDFITNLKLSATESQIAEQIINELKMRIQFLINVGLSYLSLSRSASTLSGGEAQRIRLATQIGSGLVGVLYVLDEPSIGLHQRDNKKLLNALENLRDLGNTLIVVEHDEETIECADYIIDIGPKAGVRGGYLVCAGSVDDIKECKESITGQYLSGKKKISVPKKRRKGSGKYISIKGATKNNLKNIDVDIPLGKFNVITGVSGSGKSSLINYVLYEYVFNALNGYSQDHVECKEVSGIGEIDKIINIDQDPIGRTPRSNPATYSGVFTPIRELFSKLPEAQAKGYKAGQFSFNIPGGRCENCKGDGIIKIEMHFLSDVYVPCEVCAGKRYTREILDVKYKGKNIHDVLEMTVEEACEFFANIPQIYKKLKTLYDVGLSYIKLGQSATTLSGGEAQRLKLASELAKRSTGKTLYILDEPTTGLHSDDVKKLIKILQHFCDNRNTVIVIEHNLDVIKVADHIIDLGPEGGEAGGEVLCYGTPEEICKNPSSFTGQYLKAKLSN